MVSLLACESYELVGETEVARWLFVHLDNLACEAGLTVVSRANIIIRCRKVAGQSNNPVLRIIF